MMHDLVRAFNPAVVVVDPISNLTMDRNEAEVKPTLMRLIDFLKQQQITTLFTSLTTGGSAADAPEDSQVGGASLMDTWLLLHNVEFNGERNRTLYVLKSRGMAHSNQVREFVLSDAGIDLVDAYLGNDRVFTGTARVAQDAQERRSASPPSCASRITNANCGSWPPSARRSMRKSPRCVPRRRRKRRR
jgi:circadian clock protein KaiC